MKIVPRRIALVLLAAIAVLPAVDFDRSELSSERKRIGSLCSAQVPKTPSIEWYDCIHRICIADMAKSDARTDATKAFQAGDKRLFAAMGYEGMHLTTSGIDLCTDLKPSLSRGSLDEKYSVASGGDGALSRECGNAEYAYMTKYNRQIVTLVPTDTHKLFCDFRYIPENMPENEMPGAGPN